jgi:hypothetical protein
MPRGGSWCCAAGCRVLLRLPAPSIALVTLFARFATPPPSVVAQVVAEPTDTVVRADGHDEADSEIRTLRAAAVGGDIMRLDGHLDEPAWLAADSLTDLRQREPRAGVPATEHTTVRVLRGPEDLYVAVRAFDDAARLIRATELRRDADLTVDDYVTLLIDSFRDHRGAFLFRTNPNGAMWDAQLNGLDDLNEDWNGIWQVATARDATGWTAEFRIPYRTLRFRAGETTFGFNIERFIRRKNEEVLWRSWGRAEGLFQLLNEGELVALGPLRRRQDVDVRPYALARAVTPQYDADGVAQVDGDLSAKAGIDAKVAVLPTLTADLTVNTDFAQVEADRQVINLSRFPIFFPEKREFFLESSGLFTFGTAERAQLFYSRRIGLDTAGSPVPILGGARLYGKAGPWTVGAIDARTGRGEEANDLVLRVKHDLLQRAYVGAILMDRSGPGLPGGAERAAGLDLDFPLVLGGRNLEPAFWIAGTQVPGVAGTPSAWRLSTDYPNDLFDNFVSLYRIDAGFSPTLGFVRRTGIWETTGHLDFMPRPRMLGIRQLDLLFPIPSWDIIANETGSIGRSRDWQTAEFEWRPLGGDFQNGDHFEINIQRFLDAPASPFEIFRGTTVPSGRYWWTRGELQYAISPGRQLSLAPILSVGHFYGGTNTELDLDATWRPGGKIIVGTALSRSAVRLPQGRFTALQTTLRLEYAANTRTDFLAFVQTDNEDQRIDFNLRFHWIPTIGDDVYVVWNSGYTTDPAARLHFPSARVLGKPLYGALVIKAIHRLTP